MRKCEWIRFSSIWHQKGVLMVESEANELSEDIMLEAVEFGKKSYMEV